MSQPPDPQSSPSFSSSPSSQSSRSPNSDPRYQKIRELGCNRAGGRVTYLAHDRVTGKQVIIKQFQFAQTVSNWSGFKAYEREIQALRSLNHPSIPRYLHSFETANGFCLVQEYKDAPTLATRRSFPPDQIKQIALSILDILVYLQSQDPPIIHRDLKPENILVDDHLNVYLVDFGFVRIGDGTVAMSSMAAGTFGFMAPEQLYNRKLSLATDLYGLGVTLACLLTGTPSTEVDRILDEDHQLHLKQQVPQLSSTFADWLQRMVQPNPRDRFPSAEVAQATLEPLDVIGILDVPLFHQTVELSALFCDQKLSQTLVLEQLLPTPLLEGFWEVLPDSNEPGCPVATHPWINVQPTQIKPKQKVCQIRINTSLLVENQTYQRHLCLHTTTAPETRYIIPLKIHTSADVLLEHDLWLYALLIGLFLISSGGLFTLICLVLIAIATVIRQGLPLLGFKEIAITLSSGMTLLIALNVGILLVRKQRESIFPAIVVYGTSVLALLLGLATMFEAIPPLRELMLYLSSHSYRGMHNFADTLIPGFIAALVSGICIGCELKNRLASGKSVIKQSFLSVLFPVEKLPEIGLLTSIGLAVTLLGYCFKDRFSNMLQRVTESRTISPLPTEYGNLVHVTWVVSCFLVGALTLYSLLKKHQRLNYQKTLPKRFRD